MSNNTALDTFLKALSKVRVLTEVNMAADSTNLDDWRDQMQEIHDEAAKALDEWTRPVGPVQ